MHSRKKYLLKKCSYIVSLNSKNRIKYLWTKKQYLNNSFKDNNSINNSPINDEEKIRLLFKSHNVKPIKYWINLNEISLKKEIQYFLYKKQGIYYIANITTEQFYIGSGGINNLYKRFNRHLFTFEGNKDIAKEVKLYGLNSFVYGLLEINNDYTINRDSLFELEQIYLLSCKPTYNNDNLKAVFTNKLLKLNIVDNKLKYIIDNDKFNMYMNKYLNINKDEFNKIYKDKNLSYIDYLNNNNINKSTSLLTQKGKEKIIKGRSFLLGLYDIDDNFVCSFESRKVAAHILNCSDRTIRRAIYETGYIYIPNIFILLLKGLFDIKSIPFTNNFDKMDLEYISNRNKIHMLKASRREIVNSTMFFVKDM